MQIFSLVYPVDLLGMSWANKAFRNVLTSKSSRRIWIAAFNNIPEFKRPPPCPEDLTEIAYANLLYNPCCMVRARVFASSHIVNQGSRIVGHSVARRTGWLA